MKFGPIALEEAEGAILAHGIKTDGLVLQKAKLISRTDIENLRNAGVSQVIAARLDSDDVDENVAAERIAQSLSNNGFETRPASTGRVNLHASHAGVFTVDGALVDHINSIDPAITLATLRNNTTVAAGQMIATVKIIPYAVPGEHIDTARKAANAGSIMQVHAFRSQRVGLIQTTLSGTKSKVLDKTGQVTALRLSRSGSKVADEIRANHDTATLAAEIEKIANNCDVVIVFGASATSDPNDVIPAAINLAGGTVVRVGMPVDPGNLITIGKMAGKPVIGAPGCARSPKENGFDWVLDRILAGFAIASIDIKSMGVGGLLNEIPARPRLREYRKSGGTKKLHAVLLAAGRSTRMGGPNKLLAMFDGEPLVHRSAKVLIDAGLPVTIVTGHQKERVAEALAGLDVVFAHNPDFASGLSGSLKTGVRSLPPDADGVLIALSDMPEISETNIRALAEAFEQSGGQSIIRATHAGKRGNPVILPSSIFPSVDMIEGDTGARQIVESGDVEVIDVEIGMAASLDVDTPERMKMAGGTVPLEDS